MQFGTEITGLENLDKDFDAIRAELNGKITKIFAGNGPVAERMRDTLKASIDTNVYGKYNPKVYPRRSENPEFGTPLNDVDANSSTFLTSDAGGVSLTLDYHPSGEHSGTFADLSEDVATKYHREDDAPIWKHPLNDDDLIRRIETGKGYEWRFHLPRPFWQNFVNNMVESEFASAIETAFESEGEKLENTFGSVIRDTNDGEY